MLSKLKDKRNKRSIVLYSQSKYVVKLLNNVIIDTLMPRLYSIITMVKSRYHDERGFLPRIRVARIVAQGPTRRGWGGGDNTRNE